MSTIPNTGPIRGLEKAEKAQIEVLPYGDVVIAGKYKVSMEDWLQATLILLVSSRLLGEDDPRIIFVNQVKGLRETTEIFLNGRRFRPHLRVQSS